MDGIQRQNGIIRLSHRLAMVLMPEANIEDTDTQGRLREYGYYAELHKRLLLPASYTICGIYFEHLRRCWDILIYSSEIPEPGEGLYLPHCRPIVRHNAQGKPELVRMHIEANLQNECMLRVD